MNKLIDKQKGRSGGLETPREPRAAWDNSRIYAARLHSCADMALMEEMQRGSNAL